MEKPKKIIREISTEWDKLINEVKDIDYGKGTIIIQRGVPIMLEKIIKQVKLTSDHRQSSDK